MIALYDGESEEEIGRITEAQLDFLQEHLIEETLDSYSYNLTPATLVSLEANGAEPEVLAILKKALGPRTSMELRFELD